MADPEKTSEGLEIPEYHGLQLTKHDLTLCFPELIQYDVSLGLPERDTAVDAPEHDDAENAPEWDAAGNAPELDIRREPLEVTARNSWLAPELLVERDPQSSSEAYLDFKARTGGTILDRSKRTFLVLVAILFTITVSAIGIGVGIGVGRSQGNGQGDSPNSPISSTAAAPPLKREIANDSSLSATITLDGIKHVFFQDTNGYIRQATSGHSGSSIWETSFQVMVASDARNYTPISAFIRKSSKLAEYPPINQIFVYYVTMKDQIAAVTCNSSDNVTTCNPYPLDFTSALSTSYAVATTSGSLSVSLLYDIEDGADPAWSKDDQPLGLKILMLVETDNGVVEALYGTETFHPMSENTTMSMYHVTGQFVPIIQGITGLEGAAWNFSTPFTNLALTVNGSIWFAVFLQREDKKNDTVDFLEFQIAYNTTTQNPSLDSLSVKRALGDFKLLEKDLAVYNESDISLTVLNVSQADSPDQSHHILWINSTTLDSVPQGNPATFGSPDFKFFHKRFVTVAPPGSQPSMIYLYHQINETCFEERKFGAGGWFGSEEIGV